MSRAPTVAEALDAHLDYATETGEYSRALRERIAAVLPELRIAGRRQLAAAGVPILWPDGPPVRPCGKVSP